MRRFTQLCLDLDQATTATRKVGAMIAYFKDAGAEDAAWGLELLMGRRPSRVVPIGTLAEWGMQEAGLPSWLVDASREHVGDLSETIALMLPEPTEGGGPRLSEMMEGVLASLRKMDEEEKRIAVVGMWRRLDGAERWVWNRLLAGSFRMAVTAAQVARALCECCGVDHAVMAQRLSGAWKPTAVDFRRLTTNVAGVDTNHVYSDSVENAGAAYPFCRGANVEAAGGGMLGWGTIDSLGEADAWRAEWMWDGIRAQLIRRNGRLAIWSGEQELITDRFGRLARMGLSLVDGVVMDGVILPWHEGRPQPGARAELLAQGSSRATMASEQGMLWDEAPTVFMAFDLLEWEGRDIRRQGLEERRALLEKMILAMEESEPIMVSPQIGGDSWAELDRLRAQSRERGVSGIVLKRCGSVYAVQGEGGVEERGEERRGSDWWKWRVDPLRVYAVLIGAQVAEAGVMNRKTSSLFNDYSLGLFDAAGQMVSIGRASGAGLSDEEVIGIDAFVRGNVVGKFGPVRMVEPKLVLELCFDAVDASTRHRAGLVLRNPRVVAWCRDRTVLQADRFETLNRYRVG